MNFFLSHSSYIYSFWLLGYGFKFLPSHFLKNFKKISTGFCVIYTETCMIYTGFCRISTGSRIALTAKCTLNRFLTTLQMYRDGKIYNLAPYEKRDFGFGPKGTKHSLKSDPLTTKHKHLLRLSRPCTAHMLVKSQ